MKNLSTKTSLLFATYATHTRDKSVVEKSECKSESVVCDVDIKSTFITIYLVYGYNGWLVGYTTKLDFVQAKLVNHKIWLGYVVKDFVLQTSMDDAQVFGVSIKKLVITWILPFRCFC